MLSWSGQTRTVTRQARTYYLNKADVVVVINCVKGGMNRDALDTIIVTALVITRRARSHVEQPWLPPSSLYAVKRTEEKKKKNTQPCNRDAYTNRVYAEIVQTRCINLAWVRTAPMLLSTFPRRYRRRRNARLGDRKTCHCSATKPGTRGNDSLNVKSTVKIDRTLY